MEVTHEQNVRIGGFADIVNRAKQALIRRWPMLLLVTAAVFALGVTGVFMMTPKYTPQARVRLDPTRNPLADSTNGGADQPLPPEVVETELTMLSSMDLARTVVRQLNLDQNPLFTDKLDKSSGPKLTPDERVTAVADELLRRLSVQREKLSFILDIRYTSTSATWAARIANAFAENYIQYRTSNKANTAQRQADFFQQRLDALGRQVNSAAAAAAQYRAQAGMVTDLSGNVVGTITDEQISPLSSQLASAQATAAADHAKLAAARAQIASGGLDSVAAVLDSKVIGDLRAQRAEVQRSVEEVQARYGDKHPESIRVHDQLDALDSQIDAEANRVVNSLKSTVSADDASVASLRAAMSGLRAQQAANTRAGVMADSLQREATTKRASYDKLSGLSLNSTEAAKNNSIAQAEIVEHAEVLTTPTWPKKPLMIALAFVVALAVGTGAISVQELMSAGLSSVDDVERRLGTKVLTAVPMLPKRVRPADMLLERPTSLFSESMRIARAAILGVNAEAPPQIIAITSALPSEGKTTTALAFARTLAINNAHTLLIECDVRRAAMNPMVGTPQKTAGLVEVLHGEISADEAIQPGDVPNLDHLLVREPYFSSENLFGDEAIRDLLKTMRGRYQHIVLDLPPLVGLADGRFLAVLADAVAVVVRWNVTPADAVSSAVGWLREDGSNMIGVIFSMVDATAGPVGNLYYSKAYASYYQAA
jgi:succinoglycan biosynthesis transport protein ExoP